MPYGQRRARPRLPLRAASGPAPPAAARLEAPGARTACGQYCGRCHDRGRCSCGRATSCPRMHAHGVHWEGLGKACLDAHADLSLTGDLPGQTLGGLLAAALVGFCDQRGYPRIEAPAACAKRRWPAACWWQPTGGQLALPAWQCARRGARCGPAKRRQQGPVLASALQNLQCMVSAL